MYNDPTGTGQKSNALKHECNSAQDGGNTSLGTKLGRSTSVRSRVGSCSSRCSNNSSTIDSNPSGLARHDRSLVANDSSTTVLEARVLRALVRIGACRVEGAADGVLRFLPGSADGTLCTVDTDRSSVARGTKSDSIVGEVGRRIEVATAETVHASVGCALRVACACGVELAALLDEHKVAGIAFGTKGTLLRSRTFSSERKGPSSCDNSG
jgi:hypothetical protein